MYECLNEFSEPTQAWFKHAFGSPTEVQNAAWPVIQSGKDVLVIAPTGSGKTLSAFLSAIDRLMGEHVTHERKRDQPVKPIKHGVKVLYISPLKALAVDVAKNLEAPLTGIADECVTMGIATPSVSVAIRSGDTTPKERRAIVAHPPDILVTTPESLYLLLTSKARRILSSVDTVIVDEVHAVAGTKRGAHLALSLERLDLLTKQPAQRIGLSATVNPVGEAARFLGGVRPVIIVNPESRPAMDLRVVEPLADMRDLQSAGAIAHAGEILSQRNAESHQPRISGVRPAMQRLADRRKLASMPEHHAVAECHAVSEQHEIAEQHETAEQHAVTEQHSAIDSTEYTSASGSIWPVVERSVLDQVLAHHTTLVFVNSRGLAEKLTARLNDVYADMRGFGNAVRSPEGREGFAQHYDAVVGSTTMLVQSHDSSDVIAMAHHGSVSKDRRKQIEERLKRGLLRCVVATSSLELGIDMGSVDLVIQISPPLSVSSGLQRVGRADHRVGGVSKALFYPLTREQIIGAAVSVEGMKVGAIEPLTMPHNPLDILAQQTVAAAAIEDLKPDTWYSTVRRAAPFTELSRDMFDRVMGMLTGAYADEEFSAFKPPLMWNHDDDIISARPGAQRLAVTSGGTIPDRGLYTVVLPEQDAGRGPKRVGELDEEMVYESRVGDVITLGTSSWQIQEITRDRVIVTPAPGRTARLPFWHGEGEGRDYAFGAARGRFIHDIVAHLEAADMHDNTLGSAANVPAPRFTQIIEQRLRSDGLDDNAIDNLACLLAEQQASTGVVPDDRHLVIERCTDEEGDWRVIVHSPFGKRVHEPWAMAITHRISQRYGFDGQVYAADDGIIIRLPQGEGTIPIMQLIRFDADELQHIIETQIGESVLFAARFRECAARSLFLPRTAPGRRVPLWQQRLRSAQLLNAARTKRNFPLLLETARECLQDVYDMHALRSLMNAIANGSVELVDVLTNEPSPFAENLLFGYVGTVMYQYDVPQAERSAQLLSMDPQVLERLLGDTDMSAVLDPEAIAEVTQQLESKTFWNTLDRSDIVGRITRYAKTHGPFTADQLVADTGIGVEEAIRTLDELKRRGDLLDGIFTHGKNNAVATQTASGETNHGPMQWLHRDVFRRIRSLSLAKARKAIKPVSQESYQAFLLERQGVGEVGGAHYEGIDGLMRVLEQLEGVSLSVTVWEQSVLPARVRDYQPAMLDELLAAGDIVWVGSATGAVETGKAGRISFHPSDALLLRANAFTQSANDTAQRASSAVNGSDQSGRYPNKSVMQSNRVLDSMGASQRAVSENSENSDSLRDDEPLTIPEAIMQILATSGAYRADQLATMTKRLWQNANTTSVNPVTGEITATPWSNTQFEEALWSLVWQGKVTNSSLTPLRALCSTGHSVHVPTRSSRRRVRASVAMPVTLSGLWSSVIACATDQIESNELSNSDTHTAASAFDTGVSADTDDTSECHATTPRIEPALRIEPAPRIEPERYSIEQVEVLLDRYGIIAQPLVERENIEGGFSRLYPVLRRMEEHGLLTRGMFIQGFGAAQFAARDTIDMLRNAEPQHEESYVMLEVNDPANLYGSSIAWPQIVATPVVSTLTSSAQHSVPSVSVSSTSSVPVDAIKPSRRVGSYVVLHQGRLVLFATPKSHHLLIFTDNDKEIRSACTEIAFALPRCMPGTVCFTDVNGVSVGRLGEWKRILHAAGFTLTPQGMKLYR